MAVKKAVQVGNPIIRTVAKLVLKFSTKKVSGTIKNLTDSMRHYGLVGIAAPQINVGLRIFISEIRETKFRRADLDELRVFINPTITWRSKKQVSDWEGCGSCANSNLFAKVKRSDSVVVEAQNEKGKLFTLKAAGFLARIIQHELDHLDGIIFTDTADRSTYISGEEYLKMRKLERSGAKKK